MKETGLVDDSPSRPGTLRDRSILAIPLGIQADIHANGGTLLVHALCKTAGRAFYLRLLARNCFLLGARMNSIQFKAGSGWRTISNVRTFAFCFSGSDAKCVN